MPTGADLVFVAAQLCEGAKYRLGAEVQITENDPAYLDCSELTQITCNKFGIPLPDGTWAQDAWLRKYGFEISVERAFDVPGAILLKHRDRAGNPVVPSTVGHNSYGSAHCGFSVGNGHNTVEALSPTAVPNCGVFDGRNRGWTAAFTIPGVDHHGTGSVFAPPTTDPLPAPQEQGVDLSVIAAIDAKVRATVYPGSPIRRGSPLDWEVRCIQWALNTNGYRVEVDGDFGPQTGAAVVLFQRAKQRPETGIVGRVTWAHLGLTIDD